MEFMPWHGFRKANDCLHCEQVVYNTAPHPLIHILWILKNSVLMLEGFVYLKFWSLNFLEGSMQQCLQ